MTRLRIVVLVLASSCFVIGPARAQDTPPADASPDALARAAYAEGQSAYAEGRYEDAEAAFIRAYQAVPMPLVLIGIAESRVARGLGPEAVELYERYLQVAPNGPEAPAVRERIDALRAQPGRLRVASDPPGATIALDGIPTGQVTPAELEVSPGEHEVTVEREGYEPIRGSILVPFASLRTVDGTLEPLPALEPEPLADETEPEPDAPPGPSTRVWVLSGVAGTMLLTGTVLGFAAMAREDEFRRAPRASLADRGERLAIAADVAFLASLAATTTAVIFHFADRERAEDPPGPGELTLDASPILGPGLAGGSLRIRF